jgi:hypothetical protein
MSLTHNVDLNKMFSSQSGTDGMELVNHNLNDKIYQDEISHNLSIILDKFKQKLNKEPNDTMTKIEIIDFLDNNLSVSLYNLTAIGWQKIRQRNSRENSKRTR